MRRNAASLRDTDPVVDDERRFSALFNETYGAVRRYAHHRGLAGHDADDLVAEVFTIAWARLDRVPGDDPIPWLLATARNLWRNQMRKTRRDRELVRRLPPPEPTAAPDEPADVEHIRRALASLPERDREILALIAWDDLSPQQAAHVLGCSNATARVRLHRARQRLAKALTETQPTPTTQHGRQTRPEVVHDS